MVTGIATIVLKRRRIGWIVLLTHVNEDYSEAIYKEECQNTLDVAINPIIIRKPFKIAVQEN